MMLDTAYISRNGDGSLEDRVRDYLAALSAFENMNSSKQLANDPKWADTLGDADDINQAEKIIEEGLHQATNQIDQQELERALSQGFLSKEQARVFSTTKVQLMFKRTEKIDRTKSSSSQSLLK